MNHNNTLQNFQTNGIKLSDYFIRHGLQVGPFAQKCGLSQRTVRRWLACNNPPRYAWLLAYSLAGFIMADGWEGWQFQAGGLWHASASSTKYQGLTPAILHDLAYSMQYSRSLSRSATDFKMENERLKKMIHQAGIQHAWPDNVRLLPGITKEQVLKNGGLISA